MNEIEVFVRGGKSANFSRFKKLWKCRIEGSNGFQSLWLAIDSYSIFLRTHPGWNPQTRYLLGHVGSVPTPPWPLSFEMNWVAPSSNWTCCAGVTNPIGACHRIRSLLRPVYAPRPSRVHSGPVFFGCVCMSLDRAITRMFTSAKRTRRMKFWEMWQPSAYFGSGQLCLGVLFKLFPGYWFFHHSAHCTVCRMQKLDISKPPARFRRKSHTFPSQDSGA